MLARQADWTWWRRDKGFHDRTRLSPQATDSDNMGLNPTRDKARPTDLVNVRTPKIPDFRRASLVGCRCSSVNRCVTIYQPAFKVTIVQATVFMGRDFEKSYLAKAKLRNKVLQQ